MGNIITYVRENGHLAFDELGFGEVDSLVLSQLSYLDFSCCAQAVQPFAITIARLRQSGFQSDCPSNRVEADRCRELFEAMESSRRYRDIGVDFYVNRIDPQAEMQFSAVTFRLSPRLHYIAFRGTDSTVIGWKEDLNMSYQEDIPAQRAAVRYYEDIASRMRSNYMLGGHSKGGNLAVYAAANAQQKFQQHVALIYEHDSPGFREGVLQRPGFQRIRRRIYKTVPESAVVGLLLAEHEKYTVVGSTAVAILQHDPFTWKVEGRDFVALPETDMLSRAADSTLTHWLSVTDDETRKAFVDALFGVIGATGASTIPELTENLARNAVSVAAAIRGLDPDVRRMMLRSLHSLIRATGRGVRETLDERWMRIRDSLEEQLAQTRQDVRTEFLERFHRLTHPKN